MLEPTQAAEEVPYRILVVDDDEVDRMSVRRGLARAGVSATVEEAEGTMDALSKIPRNSYDCVFLDYKIPGGDGLTLLRGIRAAGLDVPVVMLTGRADDQIAVEFMKAGASDYVAKSALTPERLAQSLWHAVSLARAQAEARRAQAELRATAERLSLALDAGRMGTWEWRIPTGEVVWSTALEAIHGIPPGSFSGSFDAFQRDMHPDDRQRVLGTVAQVVRERRPDYHIEYRIVRPDGELRWLEAWGRLISDASGAPLRMLGICTDVTERKTADEPLHDEAPLVEALHRIVSSVAAPFDLERVLQTVTDEARKLTGARFGALFYNVTDALSESRTLHLVSGTLPDSVGNMTIPLDTVILDPGFREVVRSDDIRKEPRGSMLPPLFRSGGSLPVASCLAVPVMSHSSEVRGGLFLGHPEPAVLTARHERLVVGLAGWAALAIENARLHAAERRRRAEAPRAN
jgi:PAS domain S-box-containing protein